MTRASNGDEVTPDTAKDALEYANHAQHPALEQFGRFYHALTSINYFMNVLADDDAPEYSPELLETVRGENPDAWDRVTANIPEVMAMVEMHVAEEYPDEVVWTLDRNADVEVDL